MKIGCCAGVEKLSELERLGFDYIELNLTQLAGLTDEEFAAYEDAFSKSQLKAEAFNCMIPWDCLVVGPNRDLDRMTALIETGYARAKKLGGQVVVFGSGGARRIPEDYPSELGLEDFLDCLRKVNAVADKNGLTVAIEPLNTSETNLINHVREGVKVAKAAALPHVRVLADLYHVALGGESMDEIAEAGTWLVHTHIANPDGRYYPAPEDAYDYDAFFKALKRAGYDARMSLEASAKNPDNWSEEIAASLALIRGAWAR